MPVDPTQHGHDVDGESGKCRNSMRFGQRIQKDLSRQHQALGDNKAEDNLDQANEMI
jgi:hypothetical protein